MTGSAPALLTVALLAGGALLVAQEPAPGPGTGTAAVVDSPRPIAAVPATTEPSSPVGYRWPLSPRPILLRAFAIGPYRWSPGHRGVDLAATSGQAVLAAGPGRVSFAGVVAGRPVVVVAHADGLRTTYEPVVGSVATGTAVSRGSVVGHLAAPTGEVSEVGEVGAGHCAVPCLHWGARRGDDYVDPLRLLPVRRPPVLLPLDRSNRGQLPYWSDPP